jgi:hypothetical protein
MSQTGIKKEDLEKGDLLGREFYFTTGYFSWKEPHTPSLFVSEDDCVSVYEDSMYDSGYMNQLEDILVRIGTLRFNIKY